MDNTTAEAVRLWRFQLDEPLEANWGAILSVDERERANRLKIPVIRQRFINGRVRMRHALAAELKTEPTALKFEYTSTGKPYLTGTPLHFNFSHSENCALFATANIPVGVDIERRRSTTAFESMEPTIFTAEERHFLNQRSGTERETAFFQLWTCKEALVKATGEGFQAILRYQIRFSFPDHQPIGVDLHGNTLPWSVRSFTLREMFLAAIVVANNDHAKEIALQWITER
jgi:4'-phosphopantetheinyl transferase